MCVNEWNKCIISYGKQTKLSMKSILLYVYVMFENETKLTLICFLTIKLTFYSDKSIYLYVYLSHHILNIKHFIFLIYF